MAVNVSNKQYHIKHNPSFISGERIVGDFISANHQFHEISVDLYDGDLEIWYLDRTDPAASVLAFAAGTWEIEYREIHFNNNVALSDADYASLIAAYDEIIQPRRLRIFLHGNAYSGSLNHKLQGTITYGGVRHPFSGGSKWKTPVVFVIGSTAMTVPVAGVTKYRLYSNGSYIGYIDANNVWHGEED